MHQTSMQKHVRNELPDMKFLGLKIMQTQQVIQVSACSFHHGSRKKHYCVDDDNVFSDGRHQVEAGGAVLF